MKVFAFTLGLLIIALFAEAALACPMCKDSIADTAAVAQQNYGSGGMEAGLPKGFNFSVYYMLTGLFCTLGLVIGVIAKGIRSSNAAMKRGFEVSPHFENRNAKE